jgi:hypothetical protein
MRRRIIFAAMGLAVVIAAPITARTKPMTENQKFLKETEKQLKEFEAGREPDRLTLAYLALDKVSPAHEHDPKVRAKVRAEALSLWLQLIDILDRLLDANFNPKDVPEKFVEPPPVPGGVVLRPGADPALIPDPKVRAEYEKAIAENRAKADHYRLQTHLRRLNERIPLRAEEFIRKSYTSASRDQWELRTAIDKFIKDPARKASLSVLVGR